MARRRGNSEEKADNPVKLRDATKARLGDWADAHKLGTFDDAVSILLDIADKFAKDIKIQTEPSVTITGKEERVDDGVHAS